MSTKITDNFRHVFMKILHFITAIDRSLGGVSMYIQLLTKELGKLVDLLVVTRPTNNPLPLENCRVEYLPLPISKLRQFRKQWIGILKREQPDIVHINGIWMIQTWIIQREALRMGIKTYITPHGMLEPWIINRHPWKKKLALAIFQKTALKKAIALIATAESEKQNIEQLGYNKNVVVIPNGIDVSAIRMKTDFTIKRRLLYISRIHIKKGVELLLDALEAMKDLLEGYEVVIAGEGEAGYVTLLKERARKIDKVRISFVGGIYGEQKWDLYRNSDFFVLPSYTENFGYVIAESLACGTPVITTKGTPWEDLENYHCGCWIERSVESFVESMTRFVAMDAGELKALGCNGRRLIEEKYSSASVAKALQKVYLNNNG